MQTAKVILAQLYNNLVLSSSAVWSFQVDWFFGLWNFKVDSFVFGALLIMWYAIKFFVICSKSLPCQSFKGSWRCMLLYRSLFIYHRGEVNFLLIGFWFLSIT